MDSNIKKNIIIIFFVLFILFTTYLKVILYIPFKEVVKAQYMVSSDSTISIIESSNNNKFDINEESLRVKIHNVFNDVELSRDIFISNSQLSLPRYIINYEFIDNGNNNKTQMCKIIILENGIINVDGDMFKASKNVYTDIKNILNY